MVKTTRLILLLLLVVLLLTVGCGKKDTPAVVDNSLLPKQDVASSAFDSAGQCQYCHLEIFEQWKGSMHALSYKNPAFLSVYEQTSRASDGASDQFCASCHTPVGWLANEIPPVDGSGLSPIAKEGVTCDLCHTITDVVAQKNAAFRVQPGKTKFGPLDDSLNTPLHESEFNQIYTQSEYCGACHNIVHPKNGLQLAATYSEWKESSFNSKKILCQDCHMTPGPGVTKPNPGVAATGAPKKREHTWTHYMSGGNVFARRQEGLDKHAGLAEEQLKAAASLFLGLPEKVGPFQPAKINVRIRNDGAGHYLPTGLTTFKDMWLEVVVTDGEGRTIYQNGVLDSQGKIPANSVVFKTTFADAAGQATTNLWEAAKVLDDHRIPPQQYVDEYVEIPGLPVPGILKVQVRLLYRSGAHVAPSAPIEMAKVSGQITVSSK